jgi:arginine/serine-rich splicing factor 4/5/6
MKNGFAFIEFEDQGDADECIRNLDGYEMDGRKIAVERAREPGEKGGRRDRERDRFGGGVGPRLTEGTGIKGGAVRGSRENCMMVSGLGPRTAWTDLKDWAREAGAVEYADVWHDRGKKMGVIKFQSRDDFKNALKRLDDTKLDGNYVRVFEDEGTSRSRSRGRRRSRSSSRGRKKDKSPKRDRAGSRGRDRSRDRGGDRERDNKEEKKVEDKEEKPAEEAPKKSASRSKSGDRR